MVAPPLARLVGAQHRVRVGAQADDQHGGQRGPDDLEARVAVDRGAVLLLLPGAHPELPHRVDDDGLDQHEDRHRRDQQHVVERVDVLGLLGGVGREPRDQQANRDQDRASDHAHNGHLDDRPFTQSCLSLGALAASFARHAMRSVRRMARRPEVAGASGRRSPGPAAGGRRGQRPEVAGGAIDEAPRGSVDTMIAPIVASDPGRAMQVRDGMSEVVLTVGPGHTLREAAALMADRRVGAAVVLDPDAPGPGVITERDLLRSVGAGQDPDTELVSEHLTSQLTFAGAGLVAGARGGRDDPRELSAPGGGRRWRSRRDALDARHRPLLDRWGDHESLP